MVNDQDFPKLTGGGLDKGGGGLDNVEYGISKSINSILQNQCIIQLQ